MPHFLLLCILLFSSCTADYALNSQLPAPQPEKIKAEQVETEQVPIKMGAKCQHDSDCGKNNTLPNKCVGNLDRKSGFCALRCDPLRCNDDICVDCPLAEGGCELLPNTTDFLCLTPGEASSFSPCNLESLFCRPGHFCYKDQCRPYCNAKQEPTTCINNTWCRDFFPGSEIGFCEIHEKETN